MGIDKIDNRIIITIFRNPKLGFKIHRYSAIESAAETAAKRNKNK